MRRHGSNRHLKQMLVVAAVAGGGLAGAPDAAAQTPQVIPGDPHSGGRLFLDHGCARCHAVWGNGGILGPDLGEVGGGQSLLQLAGLFWNHTPRMIETVRNRGFGWSTFTEEELADVISYIYYVKLFDEPGDPALGERWFGEKRCRECHSVGGRGGTLAPPLDGYARYVAPIALAEGMWNSGPGMRALQRASPVAMPVFLGTEMADIQAYIRQASNLRDRRVELLPPPDPANGALLFQSKGCTACHGASGRGTASGPDLRTGIHELRVSEIAGELWNHTANMAVAFTVSGIDFPRFEGNELADVVAFLYYLRFSETTGDQAAGEQLFTTKGCAACHTVDGQPHIGPTLSGSQVTASTLGLATAMWAHAPQMFDQAQLTNVDWPLFEGDEMRDLSAFLRSLASAGR